MWFIDDQLRAIVGVELRTTLRKPEGAHGSQRPCSTLHQTVPTDGRQEAVEVVIVPDPTEGGRLVASAIAALVAERPSAVIGLATGSSPAPIYDELAELCAAGKVSFRQARAFLLDEYVGLGPESPQSYRSVIAREVGERLDFAAERIVGPDGQVSDIVTACARYEAAIEAAGGVDLQILGLGGDGHIGFNEPGSSLGSATRLKTLHRNTRVDNARFFGGDPEAVPSHVVTQGVGTIMRARHLVMVAWGAHKARAVSRCAEGPITAMVPASVLQLHPHATLVVDEAAAGELSLADYYREAFASKPAWQTL